MIAPAVPGDRAAWHRVGWGVAGTAAVYAPIVPPLVTDWTAFPSLSHGFAIPIIAGYLLWARRKQMLRLPIGPMWAWLPLVGVGLALYVAGVAGTEPFLARASLPITLSGTVAFLAGTRMLREVWPAMAYLFLMIPLPYLTLKQLTDLSRVFDAKVTATLLPFLGVPVLHEGVLLHLPRLTLEVADVCSSIPAIASLVALGAAYGFVRPRPVGVRLALILAAVPLGVLSNIVRITLTAAGAHYVGPIALDNVLHLWSGTTVFLTTFAALVLLDRGLRAIRTYR
jgi:exosortase